MQYFKVAFFIFCMSIANITFTQSESPKNSESRESTQSLTSVESSLEERIRRISTMVLEQVNLQSEPGYYIPSIGFGFRFGGETLFDGEVANTSIPMFGFHIGIHFLRFTSGFGVVRLLIEAPISKATEASASDLTLLNSQFSISGGFGGGFSFFDSRLRNKGMGNVLTISFLATVGTRIGVVSQREQEPSNAFGGAEVSFAYHYYFHRYASLKFGWDLGLRLGAISTATYNFSVGMAF
ncbi:MAG: hypothetical protein ACRC9L_07055 [Brevinema sp.]